MFVLSIHLPQYCGHPKTNRPERTLHVAVCTPCFRAITAVPTNQKLVNAMQADTAAIIPWACSSSLLILQFWDNYSVTSLDSQPRASSQLSVFHPAIIVSSAVTHSHSSPLPTPRPSPLAACQLGSIRALCLVIFPEESWTSVTGATLYVRLHISCLYCHAHCCVPEGPPTLLNCKLMCLSCSYL